MTIVTDSRGAAPSDEGKPTRVNADAVACRKAASTEAKSLLCLGSLLFTDAFINIFLTNMGFRK
jgi:hypothetical protein